ncbi:MAG: protein kinase [Deltaproteobacteria bacterium]|nr:protein kinase [Deltaproteobacteria bacterium]
MDPVTPSKRKGVLVEPPNDGPTDLSRGTDPPWDASNEVEDERLEFDTPSINPTTHFPIPHKPKGVITTGDLPPPAQAAHAPDDAPLESGTMLGDYRIEAQIGEGGMGVVYAAVHPLIGKRAAVKVLKAELCRAAFNVERFIDEARIVNQIGHPNIVDVFAFGQTKDGRSYFVMEWLKGESLRSRIARSRLALDEVCEVIRPLARALEAAHEHGVIHRDLKPDNIYLIEMRGEAPRVKLLDFGIAKLAREEHRMERTATGAMVGTPQYIAPEQAKGYAIDNRVDIYAVGGILFELLTGRPPFEADNAMEMVAKHLMEAPPRPSSVADVPAELDDLVLRMLSKDPNGRPTLAEVATVIERTSALDRTSVKTMLPPVRPRSEPVINIPRPTPTPTPSSSLKLKPMPLGTATPGALSEAVPISGLSETIRAPMPRQSGMGKKGVLLLVFGVLTMAIVGFLFASNLGSKSIHVAPEPRSPTNEPITATPPKFEQPPKVEAAIAPKVEPKVEPKPTPTVEAKNTPKVEPKPAVKPKAATVKANPPRMVAAPKPPPKPPVVPKTPKPGRLELSITGGKGTPKVVIDGVASSLSKELAPGVHTISVTAPGAKPYTTSVTIEEGKTLPKKVILFDVEKPKETPITPPPAKDDLLAPGSLEPSKK